MTLNSLSACQQTWTTIFLTTSYDLRTLLEDGTLHENVRAYSYDDCICFGPDTFGLDCMLCIEWEGRLETCIGRYSFWAAQSIEPLVAPLPWCEVLLPTLLCLVSCYCCWKTLCRGALSNEYDWRMVT